MSLTSDEMQALIWPIKAKGAVQRWSPLGDPTIETFYHNAIEGGRMLEKNIADANHWLLQKKQLLITYIQHYTHMNSLAVNGQLPHTPRVPKYVADSISILQAAIKLQREVISVVAALQQNITMLLAIEQSLLKMVQTALNSIANLLNNICNWGIPALPSIPNLFKDTIWNWNGFTFSPLAIFAVLKSSVHFDFNFSFKQCSFGATSPSYLFVNNPLSTQTYSGLVYGSGNYDPPFGNASSITPTNQNLSDPTFIATMQATEAYPIYSPTFNPNTEMFGSIPDPHQVIDNWQMPATVYTSNIVAICPQLRSNVILVGASDYSSPNLTVRNPELRKSLIDFINLAAIINSNYDPFIVSAWLIYLNSARTGREGVWLPNFAAVYNQYLQPSIDNLNLQAVPWNDVLNNQGFEDTNYIWMGTWDSTVAYVQNDLVTFNGVNYIALTSNTNAEPDTNLTDWGVPPANTVYSNAPVISLISIFQNLPANQLTHLLWQFSYIEASLLGYVRNSFWDTNQDANYLASPTGADLDYRPTAVTAAQSNATLGESTAEFPVPITYPTAMQETLDQVIALATINIQNDLSYLSPRLGNRFTYNQFAQATQVDRFSQFWRDFATNLSNFLIQDPYLVQFAITYPEILDGALDPLASTGNSAAYASLLADTSSRNRKWTPGTPLLTIPVAPVTGLTNDSSPLGSTNGWISPMELDPIAFLARPDIQVLPIPVQTAMLRTNLSYAGINLWANQIQTEIDTQLANANALIQTAQLPGFSVSIYTTTTSVQPTSNVSIETTDVTDNILTVNFPAPPVHTPLPFSVGQYLFLTGTAESDLNNAIVQVDTITLVRPSSNFTVSIIESNFSNDSDSGIAQAIAGNGAGTPIVFDPLEPPQDFDYTGNYQDTIGGSTFTIQTAGAYSGFAIINWNVLDTDTVTITVTQNGMPLTATSITGTGDLTTSVSFNGDFSTGDIMQVLASTANSVQNVVPSLASSPPTANSVFCMIQIPS